MEQHLNSPLTRAAGLWLIGGGLAAVSRIVERYEHATWLVAYLLLVGFLAQFLLARGQIAFPAPTDQLVRAQALLWNFGVIAVPAGVLGGVRIPIAVGSLALICALALFWRSVRPSYRVGGAGRAAIGRGYAGLLIFMLASVIAGMLLASDVPWAGGADRTEEMPFFEGVPSDLRGHEASRDQRSGSAPAGCGSRRSWGRHSGTSSWPCRQNRCVRPTSRVDGVDRPAPGRLGDRRWASRGIRAFGQAGGCPA